MDMICNCKDCQHTTTDPVTDGWRYIVFPPKPGYAGTKPGWWCPPCVEDLEGYCAERGQSLIKKQEAVH
jgi:hypothetical protein